MYKGDVEPETAFNRLLEGGSAVLIDVRTLPEWSFVGLPLVDNLIRLSWQIYPSMEVDPDFAGKVRELGVPEDADIFMLCRSGVRSAHAATALTQAGYKNAYNVAGGFEGDKDEDGHRGNLNGWKHAGLPWAQG